MEIRVSLCTCVTGRAPTERETDQPFVRFHRVIEMHTFLVTLVRQFDFSLPDEKHGVKGMAMRSGVGEEDKGPQMLLKVTSLGNE